MTNYEVFAADALSEARAEVVRIKRVRGLLAASEADRQAYEALNEVYRAVTATRDALVAVLDAQVDASWQARERAWKAWGDAIDLLRSEEEGS